MSAVLGINSSNRPNVGLARFKATIHLPEEKPSFGQKNEIQKIASLQKITSHKTAYKFTKHVQINYLHSRVMLNSKTAFTCTYCLGMVN